MPLDLALVRSRFPIRGRGLPGLLGLDLHGELFDKLLTTAHVGLAYGEPIKEGKTTVVPVGAVAYGFGMGRGGGAAKVKGRGEDSVGGGAGGGGGVRVTPLAYIEIGPKGTKLRPILDWTSIIVAFIAALVPAFAPKAVRKLGGFLRRKEVRS